MQKQKKASEEPYVTFLECSSPKADHYIFGSPEEGSLLILSAFSDLWVFL